MHFQLPKTVWGKGGFFVYLTALSFMGVTEKLVLKVLQSSADEMVYFP